MNKKLASLIVAAACIVKVNAQTKLTITYKNGTIKGSTDEYKKNSSPVKWTGKYKVDEFTINDSITYYQTIENYEATDEFSMISYKRSRKNKVLGKNFVPNAAYCNYSAGTVIDEIEWKDDSYYVKDTIPNKQEVWTLSDETKTVLGYPCKMAYTITDGVIDKIVWYTDNFKCNLSASGDNTLPGTIMETFYPKSNTLITAIDLQIETNTVNLNVKGNKIISKAEFDKIKKNKKGS